MRMQDTTPLPNKNHPRKILTILVPVYNEEANVRPFYERLKQTLEKLSAWGAEVIFIDDGSRDGSFAILQDLHRQDSRIKILRLSRNFGSWGAVLAGFHAASGDAVVWMASDMQDPPELLPRLLLKWEEGAEVVWATRSERHDPWGRRVSALLFYRLLRRIALPNYPLMGTDICLMDRRVAKLLGQLREHNRFTQGLILSLGFTQATVPYVREKRGSGRSKFNLPRLLKIGMDMILSFSYFPIRLMLYLGTSILLAAVVFAAVFALRTVVWHADVAGWGWVTLAVFFVGSLQLIMLGVLGEYLWRVLDEVRERPQYVVRDRFGFQAEGGDVRAQEHNRVRA